MPIPRRPRFSPLQAAMPGIWGCEGASFGGFFGRSPPLAAMAGRRSRRPPPGRYKKRGGGGAPQEHLDNGCEARAAPHQLRGRSPGWPDLSASVTTLRNLSRGGGHWLYAQRWCASNPERIRTHAFAGGGLHIAANTAGDTAAAAARCKELTMLWAESAVVRHQERRAQAVAREVPMITNDSRHVPNRPVRVGSLCRSPKA